LQAYWPHPKNPKRSVAGLPYLGALRKRAEYPLLNPNFATYEASTFVYLTELAEY